MQIKPTANELLHKGAARADGIPSTACMQTSVRRLIPLLGLITTFGLGRATAGVVFPITTTSAIESGLEAAFGGNNYLVGVRGGPLAEGTITAQLISPTGGPLDSVSFASEFGGMPHVAFDGTNYLMV